MLWDEVQQGEQKMGEALSEDELLALASDMDEARRGHVTLLQV